MKCVVSWVLAARVLFEGPLGRVRLLSLQRGEST
jgi:hypothetical protein